MCAHTPYHHFCKYWGGPDSKLDESSFDYFFVYLNLGKCLMKYVGKQTTAAMHGPHSVFDIGNCTVKHSDAAGVSLADQWKAEKNWYSFNWPITRCFLKPRKNGVVIEH